MGGEGDQRPAPRFVVTVFVGRGEDEHPFGRTRDVSLSGMFLATSERPPVGSVQEVSLVWGDETVSCTARVVRHAEDGIALTFVDPGEAFQHALAEIVSEGG